MCEHEVAHKELTTKDSCAVLDIIPPNLRVKKSQDQKHLKAPTGAVCSTKMGVPYSALTVAPSLSSTQKLMTIGSTVLSTIEKLQF